MAGEIEVKELNVSFNGTRVLRDLTMSFPTGKVTAVIGPSGCGKTTLLRCLNRLHDSNKNCRVEGDVYLDGQGIREMDPMLLRRRVGMLFQKPNPFPMSVRENVLYGVKATRCRVDHDHAVQSSLTKAALWDEIKDRLHEHAFTLSVGQQQRLCMARSLAISPEVILLDEPAASLDPSSAAKIEASIAAMRDEYTVIIVTHNMQQARRVSDYTGFIYLGELMEFGESDQVFGQPRRIETREYVEGRFG